MRMALLAGVALLSLSTVATAQQALRVGQTVSGSLAAGDTTLPSGELYDSYVVNGRAGQTITVRLTSNELDPYVIISGDGGFKQDNDDVSPSDRSAELVVRLPPGGQYRITATTYQRGERGRYSLSVRDGNHASAGAAPANTPTADNRNAAGTVRAGDQVSGGLNTGDTTISSGEYIDNWILSGQRGDSFEVTLQSSEFDPYLLVRGPGGLSEENDDEDNRGGRNARLRFTLPADGDVQIGATSFRQGEVGRYTLAVNAMRPGSPSAAPAASPSTTLAASGDVIAPGMRINGDLAASDRQLGSGEYTDHFTLEGRAGQRIELRLESGDFDPFIQINGPGNFIEANDDDPAGGRNSRLNVTLPADGSYTVMATSYAARETGRYTLRVGDAMAGNALRDTPTTRAAASVRPAAGSDGSPSIAMGESARGRLADGDERLGASGEYVDTYRFTAERGQRVAIDIVSSNFDTYAILQPPGDAPQIDNDDGPDGTNARIDQVMPASGEYRVLVTSFRAGETGDYRITVAPSVEPARLAAVPGGQRVFALMVGLSDYGGTNSDLNNTDEDARKLAESLRRAGVLNPASIVLTNAEGTREGVRRAFANVAAQAGPDDMFLFFYSGHGNQIDSAPSATEPDGREETLVLRDGELTDNDLAEMFGTVRARLALAILDSCYSGGFARDLVNRPGVMGIFSSEEDLTSLVAEKFEAGGYLAHFVRSALAGEADDNGDSILSAGELAAYLRLRFNAPDVGLLAAETTDGQHNYQNLVIDRGGVQVDDVVIRLSPATTPATTIAAAN